MHGNHAKKIMKNDENGQLSYVIYSSPAAARSPLQGWVGDRCHDRSIFFCAILTILYFSLFNAFRTQQKFEENKKIRIEDPSLNEIRKNLFQIFR